MSDEMWNQEQADKLIPAYMQGGLKRWIENGIRPGSFLEAVLENNLKEAVGRADHNNIKLLYEYVNFLYNYCPASCWGSPEKVEDWECRNLKN